MPSSSTMHPQPPAGSAKRAIDSSPFHLSRVSERSGIFDRLGTASRRAAAALNPRARTLYIRRGRGRAVLHPAGRFSELTARRPPGARAQSTYAAPPEGPHTPHQPAGGAGHSRRPSLVAVQRDDSARREDPTVRAAPARPRPHRRPPPPPPPPAPAPAPGGRRRSHAPAVFDDEMATVVGGHSRPVTTLSPRVMASCMTKIF